MEQRLYSQVVKLRLKDLKFIEANKNKKMRLNSSSKVNLQDQSVGLILPLIVLKTISTREPDLYKNIIEP